MIAISIFCTNEISNFFGRNCFQRVCYWYVLVAGIREVELSGNFGKGYIRLLHRTYRSVLVLVFSYVVCPMQLISMFLQYSC